MKWILFSGILFYFACQEVQAQDNLDLECYACSYNYHPTANDDCVRDPEKLGTTVWCDSSERRCFEQSQYDINNGYIRTFSRGCEVITREDGCETDQFYELCLYTCDTHLCNDEDHSIGPPPTTPPPPTAETTTKVRDLTCYSCQYSYHPDVEDTCVTAPEELPPTNQVQCSSEERECFTYMQYSHTEGYVRSFTRGCEVLDDTEEGCVTDIYFDTCWTKCSTDLCNDGDGWPEGEGPEDGEGPDGGDPDGEGPDGGDPDGEGPDGGDPDGEGPDGGDPDGGNPDGENSNEGTPDGDGGAPVVYSLVVIVSVLMTTSLI